MTYSGIEATQIIMEPVFTDEDILSSFKVMPNVVTKKKMQFARKLEKIVRKYTGCGFTPIGAFDVYDREVEVNKMKVDLKLCIDEFMDTIFEELLNRGINMHNLSATLLERLLIDRIRKAMVLDIDRIYHFSNPSNPDPNYDQMEGIWTVHYPDLVAGDFIPYLNTGSGSALSAGDGIDILRSVWDNAPLPLKGLPNTMKQFNVSGTVYTQYREDIENGGGGDYGLIAMINGQEQLLFRGVPVRSRWRWNEIMEQDFASPESHLVELTSPMNKVVATDLLNANEQLRIWYDEKDEHLYVKSRWKLGGDYVHHSLISVGY